MAQFTLSQWIAMIMEKNQNANIEGATESRSRDPGFSVKIPGSKTLTFFVHPDGGELFPSAVESGGIVEQIVSDDDMAAASSTIILLSGILEQFTKALEKH